MAAAGSAAAVDSSDRGMESNMPRRCPHMRPWIRGQNHPCSPNGQARVASSHRPFVALSKTSCELCAATRRAATTLFQRLPWYSRCLLAVVYFFFFLLLLASCWLAKGEVLRHDDVGMRAVKCARHTGRCCGGGVGRGRDPTTREGVGKRSTRSSEARRVQRANVWGVPSLWPPPRRLAHGIAGGSMVPQVAA